MLAYSVGGQDKVYESLIRILEMFAVVDWLPKKQCALVVSWNDLTWISCKQPQKVLVSFPKRYGLIEVRRLRSRYV